MLTPAPPPDGSRVAPLALLVVLLGAPFAAVAPASAGRVSLPSGTSTAEAAETYQRLLQGGDEGPPQIVESACERRLGGRLCPQLAPGADLDAAAAGEVVETSGRWFFVPPLPPAALPEGARLGGAEGEAGLETWMVRDSFVAGGAEQLAAWRRQATEDALVDCTVSGCQSFAFVDAPDRPADEEWLAKCWVEVADGVRGAPYGCRQVAATREEESWLRARMSWQESESPRSPRPPFRAVAVCGERLAAPARALATALEAPPLELAARPLQRGDEAVAVAAPRASPVVAASAEWPSFRLRLVEAQPGGPEGVRWAYDVEVDQRLLVAPPGSDRDAAWTPAPAADIAAWDDSLRRVAATALERACRGVASR